MEWRPINTFVSRLVKDMEVMGDQCVLTIREATGQLALTMVTLVHPKQPYTIQVNRKS